MPRCPRHVSACVVVAGVAIVAVVGAAWSGAAAQTPAGAARPAGTPRAVAPLDFTGTWVSVVTEEWRWRMLTPAKGDYTSIPLNDEGRKVADGWDPARDTATGSACRAYGAVGVMRMPGRFRISWQDDRTLKVEIDAGQQVRLLRFGDTRQSPRGDAGWQGVSTAKWQAAGGGDLIPVVPLAQPGAADRPNVAIANTTPQGGSLKVETAQMRPGYLRKNGVPYSADATLTERFFVHTEPDGSRWLTVTQVVRDPRYLAREYVTSWDYLQEANDAKFRPSPCRAS